MAGAGAVSALGSGGVADAATTTRAAARAVNSDVVGKITVGYQGWFAAPGDGSPINRWWHWSQNDSVAPSPSNTTIRAWPDVSEFSQRYTTDYGSLPDGGPAQLFSSWSDQTVDRHFAWMQQYGCDTAALQRFDPNGIEGPTRDGMAAKVRKAAEAHARKFYVMYDVSGWGAMQSELKADWTTKMSKHTASAAYARHGGKPVVCIWGFGFNDGNHDFSADACIDVIQFLKAAGCYVIGGVPTHWRDAPDGADSVAGFEAVYESFDMLSPWMVGRIGTTDDVDSFLVNVQRPDKARCDALGIAYQPCVLPGDLSEGQRRHGDFMWRQFYDLVGLGVSGIYISMFDEFNEGNQIAKTAATQASVPQGSGFRSLDEDGTPCSSDYYLRLTHAGGKMLKRQIALTATRPTSTT
jgi:hypothetical protein